MTATDAETAFDGAGVIGGPISNDTTGTVAFPSYAILPSSTSPSHSSGYSSSFMSSPSLVSDGVAVVTVTITVLPSSFSTALPTQITTIQPDEARSIIASLVVAGGTIINPLTSVVVSQASPTDSMSDSATSSQTLATVSCAMNNPPSDSTVPSPTPASAYRVRRSQTLTHSYHT